MEAGYAFRWQNIIKVNKDEFFSLPNDYFALNPTHIPYLDKIDKATAYKVQKYFGKVNASRNTIEACKGVLNPAEIRIEEMTEQDYIDRRDEYWQFIEIQGTRYYSGPQMT